MGGGRRVPGRADRTGVVEGPVDAVPGVRLRQVQGDGGEDRGAEQGYAGADGDQHVVEHAPRRHADQGDGEDHPSEREGGLAHDGETLEEGVPPWRVGGERHRQQEQGHQREQAELAGDREPREQAAAAGDQGQAQPGDQQQQRSHGEAVGPLLGLHRPQPVLEQGFGLGGEGLAGPEQASDCERSRREGVSEAGQGVRVPLEVAHEGGRRRQLRRAQSDGVGPGRQAAHHQSAHGGGGVGHGEGEREHRERARDHQGGQATHEPGGDQQPGDERVPAAPPADPPWLGSQQHPRRERDQRIGLIAEGAGEHASTVEVVEQEDRRRERAGGPARAVDPSRQHHRPGIADGAEQDGGQERGVEGVDHEGEELRGRPEDRLRLGKRGNPATEAGREPRRGQPVGTKPVHPIQERRQQAAEVMPDGSALGVQVGAHPQRVDGEGARPDDPRQCRVSGRGGRLRHRGGSAPEAKRGAEPGRPGVERLEGGRAIGARLIQPDPVHPAAVELEGPHDRRFGL